MQWYALDCYVSTLAGSEASGSGDTHTGRLRSRKKLKTGADEENDGGDCSQSWTHVTWLERQGLRELVGFLEGLHVGAASSHVPGEIPSPSELLANAKVRSNV